MDSATNAFFAQMHVVVASDHAGFVLKNSLKEYLQEKGIQVVDLGPEQPERCDYPDYAKMVCVEVLAGKASWGLLCCGTGIGMSISANRHKGIRAAVVSDCFSAMATRQHNDANVLCLGERVVGVGLAQQIVDAWIEASFEGGRHQLRIDKIDT